MKLTEALQQGIAKYEGDNIRVVKKITELTINQPIGGSLDCSNNQLTELTINQPIGGWLDCHNNQLTELTINQPIGGWLYCYSNPLKETPKYDILAHGQRGENWIYADGILSHFHKIRKVGETTFYIGFKYTVAEQNGQYAHGDDMRSSLLDLRFKLADRDKSTYEGLTLESKLTYDDAIILYRIITGACRQGTQHFLDSAKPEQRDYTVREIIEKTKGQYGSEALQNFFIGGNKC
jgi:hypothetical protein